MLTVGGWFDAEDLSGPLSDGAFLSAESARDVFVIDDQADEDGQGRREQPEIPPSERSPGDHGEQAPIADGLKRFFVTGGGGAAGLQAFFVFLAQ